MGTRQDCKRGEHTCDNQGLCWWCGKVMNQEWFDEYNGTTTPEKPAKKAKSRHSAGKKKSGK